VFLFLNPKLTNGSLLHHLKAIIADWSPASRRDEAVSRMALLQARRERFNTEIEWHIYPTHLLAARHPAKCLVLG